MRCAGASSPPPAPKLELVFLRLMLELGRPADDGGAAEWEWDLDEGAVEDGLGVPEAEARSAGSIRSDGSWCVSLGVDSFEPARRSSSLLVLARQ